MGSSYDILISKINEFTRKFYLNKLLRGSIYAAASILGLYLFVFIFVYYLHPGIIIKTCLFFAFLLLAFVAIAFWIVKPALAYYKIGENLTLEQASLLIGNHFFNIKDKLVNTIQLKALADQSPQNSALIMAGIDQKISSLRPVPFTSAINLSANRRYMKYILIPLSVILTIGIIAPAILKEGTKGFIRYNEEILPEAPFKFVVLNKGLTVTQGDDITLNLGLKGNEFPQDIYVEDGINTYKVEKQSISRFNYTFKNLQKNKSLRFYGGGFKSTPVTIVVKPRPAILNVSTTLVFPSYLNRKTEKLDNAGDLLVPEGTEITWQLRSENSSALAFVLQHKVFPLTVKNDISSFTHRITASSNYSIVPQNEFVEHADSIGNRISVIADQFPTIELTATPDSLSNKALYFSGAVADDYGLSALTFRYEIKKDGKTLHGQRIPVPIQQKQLENVFFYFWDLNKVPVNPGELLTYYFEVADNDGVNGPKTTRSAIKIYQLPAEREIIEKAGEHSESLKQKMQSAIKLAKDIEKEGEKLRQQLLDKKQLNFEDRKQIEQLLEKQKQLEEAVKEIKKQNEKNTFEKEENNLIAEELKEKQKQIDKLFNDALDEKTKELLQKLQQLMDLNNKDQARDGLSKMQMDNKTLRNELSRILELYKQLEFEQLLQHKIDRLNDMSKKQQSLSNENKSENTSSSSALQKQEELNQDFKALQKELEQLADKNDVLERPNNYQNPEKEGKAIAKSQQNSKESLTKNDRKKAAEEQAEAAKQLEQLARQLRESQQQNESRETQVNAKELRRLLENLLRASFEQEKTMLSLKKMTINDPNYVQAVRQQQITKDQIKGIADSLFSLSKRVPQIESTVNTEIDKINMNIEKSLNFLGERRTIEANRFQQYAMTSLNNLALMLNEALSQMQNGKGGGKGKQQSLQELQKMQEELNKNMQNARDKLQKEGNLGRVPKGQMSEEFAKMAQQQQMIREALQKINQNENKDGKGSLGNLNQAIKDMKQTEAELVNKRIEEETLKRQKELLTRLLDANNAKREQDEESKRESNAGKEFPPSYQQMLEKFKKQRQGEHELIQKLPPGLNYYYKSKIAKYFKLLNSPPK